MSEQTRRRFTAQEKVGLLKQHLAEGKAVSEVCEAAGINPTMFYRWQQELFEHGAAVFERKPERSSARWERKVAELEEKLARKNEVLSELMEEHVALKKSLGEI